MPRNFKFGWGHHAARYPAESHPRKIFRVTVVIQAEQCIVAALSVCSGKEANGGKHMGLRHTFRRQIRTALDHSRFTADDFEIEYPEAEALLLISFKSFEQFHFFVHDDGLPGQGYRVDIAPGVHYEMESRRIQLEAIVGEVEEWANRIYAELMSIEQPVDDSFAKLRAELEEGLDDNIEDPAAFFTEEEAAQIREKIKGFDEVLQQHAQTHEDLRGEIDALRKQLSESVKAVETFPKSIWLRTTFNRVAKGVKGLAKSKEAKQVLVEGLKTLVKGYLGADGPGPDV